MNLTISKTKALFKANFPELILLIAFCYLQFTHINRDFWNDKIYSLKYFTFVTIRDIVFDYHNSNNHIFFNLINNIYLKIIKIETISELFESPYKLRLLPFTYSLFTLYFLYQLSKKIYSKNIALLTIAILITTIPFFNFSMQIRGYGLSTLLLVLVVYFSFTYLNSQLKKHLYLIIIFTALFFYTIPSNIYYILSLIVLFFIYFLKSEYRTIKNKSYQQITNNVNFKILYSLIIGVSISILFYLPVFNDVFFNDFVQNTPPNSMYAELKTYIVKVFSRMNSNRWTLFFLCLFGFTIKLFKDKKIELKTLFFIGLFLFPFLMMFLRKDYPPLRIFVVIAPIFALIIAIGISHFWSIIDKKRKYFIVFFTLLFLYLSFNFNSEYKHIKQQILKDIHQSKRSQDLYAQYHKFYYHPLIDIRSFKYIYNNRKMPVFIYGCEPYGVNFYLEKFHIPYTQDYFFIERLDTLLLENESIYVVTNKPNDILNIDQINATMINRNLSYHNIIVIQNNCNIK